MLVDPEVIHFAEVLHSNSNQSHSNKFFNNLFNRCKWRPSCYILSSASPL